MAGHLTMCALRHGQECEVLVPGPHVQRYPGDQTTLQEASTHQVRARNTAQLSPGEKTDLGLLLSRSPKPLKISE